MVWQDKDKTRHTLASLCCPQYHVRRPEGAADGCWKQSQGWPHTSGLLLYQQINIFVHIMVVSATFVLQRLNSCFQTGAALDKMQLRQIGTCPKKTFPKEGIAMNNTIYTGPSVLSARL